MDKLELSQELEQEIFSMRREASAFFRDKNYGGIEAVMSKAWNKLPDPKLSYSESFLIARMMCEAALGANDFASAKHWVDVYKNANLSRLDSGERDFMEGRLSYAMGDFTKAKTCFAIADSKSDGRCWKADGVMDYFKFYKQK